MVTFSCPNCGSKLMRPAVLLTGDPVVCSRCRHQFQVPPESEPLAPEPPTPLRQRLDQLTAEPRRSSESRDPSYTDRIEPGESDYGDESRRRDREDWAHGLRRGGPVESLPTNFSVDLGLWWNRAKKHYSAYMGAAIGFGFIAAFLQVLCGFIPIISGFISFFVLTPLTLGAFIPALKQTQGRPWDFNDFFGGYNYYWNVLGYSFLLGLIMLPCFLFLLGGFFLLLLMSPGQPPNPDLLLTVLGISAVPTLLLVMYLGIRLGTFGPLLIVDRNYGAVEALRGSWRMTNGKVVGLLGVHLMLALLVMGGLLLCIVGVLFVAPMVTLVWTAGYLSATESGEGEAV